MKLLEILDHACEWEQIERARQDPVFFGHYCFRDPHGEPWIIGDPLHYEWQDFVPRKGPWQGVVVGFRDSMKTSQLGFLRVLWELGHDPSLRVKYVTCNDDKAKEHLEYIKQNIESNERLHAVFPDLRPGPKRQWLSKRINVKGRPVGQSRDYSIEVSGITTNASGGRGDLLIFDDIIDYKTVLMEPRTHEKIVEYFSNTWMALGTRGRRILLIGIPTTHDDLLAQKANDPAWAVYRRCAIEPDPVTGELVPTFPQFWPLERLEEQRAALGERAFQRQFMLKAINPDERYFGDRQIMRCLEPWEIGENVHPDWPRYGGVDMAQSARKKASFSVIFTIAVDPATGRRHPVEIVRAKLRPTELKDAVIEQSRRHHWIASRVENNAMQEILIEWLGEAAADVPTQGHYTGANKFDPEIGLPRLIQQMTQGAWVIPLSPRHREHSQSLTQRLDLDTDTAHCPVCAWRMEMEKFPTAPTCDILMAMWLADAAVEQSVMPRRLPTVVGSTRRALPTAWRR